MDAADPTSINASQLISTLLQADGALTIDDPATAVRSAYRRAIWQAREDGLVPVGHRIRHDGRDRGDLRIWLDSTETAPVADEPLAPVPVPARLTRPDPVVAATRDALTRGVRDEHGRNSTGAANGLFDVRVARPQIGRAMRILQGLVAELQRRGHDLDTSRRGCARIQIGDHAYNLRVIELLDRSEHQPAAGELAASQRPFGARMPKYDYTPSGRLTIELDTTYQGRRRRWTDTTRWALEDKLPDVLQELEQRAEIDERRRVKRERAEEQRRHERQRQLDEARKLMAEERRALALEQEITAWQRAEAIRSYCDRLDNAMRRACAPASWEWVRWARRHADTIDPTRQTQLPAMPASPTISNHEVEIWLRDQQRTSSTSTWR